MTKCDFGNSFTIPLGNGAWEINPLYKPTPDIASHCPQFTLSTSGLISLRLDSAKLIPFPKSRRLSLTIPPPLFFGTMVPRRS